MRDQSMSAGRGRPVRLARRQRAAHGLAGAVGEPRLELRQDLADDLAGRRPGLVGQRPVELDEQRHEVEVGFQLVEQLRLEQQLVQVEALDGVALQHLHDRRREVAADVAEPAGDGRRRPGQAAGAAGAPARGRGLVVERAERDVDALVVAAQVDAGAVGGPAAEHEPPAAQALLLRDADRT